MVSLKVVTGLTKPALPEKSRLTTIHAGRRYDVGCQDLSALNSTHGVIGDYRMTIQCGEIIPITSETSTGKLFECFFWDADIDFTQLQCSLVDDIKNLHLPLQDCKLSTNRLVLKRAELKGPELTGDNGETSLSLSPRFDFTFSTDSFAAQLGVIHLVQSTRFITLEKRKEIHLVDTSNESAPVLYLENPRDEQAIKFVVTQSEAGITREHNFTTTISQPIPDEVDGETVASVTVLEQYHSYFMQCAIPPDDRYNIWIPIYAPIAWGWSIRVGRRTDGDWGILRRKLILPTTGHDGLLLPTWSNNTIACSSFLKT